MELAKGGEVFDRLVEMGNFDEEVTASVVVQLLCAIDYIHKQGIIHRFILHHDVNPLTCPGPVQFKFAYFTMVLFFLSSQ